MSNSHKSWEDAAQTAITEASKSIKQIKSIYIKEHSAVVDEKNKISDYRITASISFEVDTSNNK